MAAEESAYAVLGLEPGADSAAIERTYKKLIKQYHPDRGGDPRRAAEINRAFRELRSARMPEPLTFADEEDFVRTERNGWARVALSLAALVLALLLATGPAARLFGALSPPASLPKHARHSGRFAPAAEAMDRPLNASVIDSAVHDALHLSRREDEMALANSSRDCHRALRLDPSLQQLDRCAAFDDAVVELQNRDPLRDRGPFSEVAVTGRLMGGATLLSNDYLAIDSRLDRIRLQVELALAPPPPPPITNAAEAD